MWSTPAALATAIVSSVLPSSITIQSTRAKPGTPRGRAASVMPRVAASLKQGIWMIRVGAADMAASAGRAPAATGAGTTMNRLILPARSGGIG